jgi:hypothetical protein
VPGVLDKLVVFSLTQNVKVYATSANAYGAYNDATSSIVYVKVREAASPFIHVEPLQRECFIVENV